MKQTYQQLIQTLVQCAKHCEECASACLQEENLSEMRECIRMNLCCAALCQGLAKLLVYDSPQLTDIVVACSSLGTQCAQECARHPMDHCQECAEVCREMAAQCGGFVASP